MNGFWPPAAAGIFGMQNLRLDLQTAPGLACALAGTFLLLLAFGVIGRNAESEDLRKWLPRRRRRFQVLGGLLLALGIYLFLDAHGAFLVWP